MGYFSESEKYETVGLMKAYDRVVDAADGLYEEELEVLAEVAEALLRSQEGSYGAFNLADDPRDMKRESWDEDRDWLAYRAADIVKDRIRSKKESAE